MSENTKIECLAYVSLPDPNLCLDDLFDILTAARERNFREDVTGILIFGQNIFFQILEGQKNALETIMQSIKNDQRHSNVAVLTREPADKRLFKHWSMAFRDINPQDTKYLSAEIGWDTAKDSLLNFTEANSTHRSMSDLMEVVHSIVRDFKSPS